MFLSRDNFYQMFIFLTKCFRESRKVLETKEDMSDDAWNNSTDEIILRIQFFLAKYTIKIDMLL